MRIKEYNEPVATAISRIMADRGIKQIYIAEKAGYSKQVFNDMLNGRRIIKLTDIPPIATALGVTPNELFGIEPADKPA